MEGLLELVIISKAMKAFKIGYYVDPDLQRNSNRGASFAGSIESYSNFLLVLLQ